MMVSTTNEIARYKTVRQQAALGAPPVASAYLYPGVANLAEKLVGVVGQFRAGGPRRSISDRQIDEVVGVVHIGWAAHDQGKRQHTERIVSGKRPPQLG